VSNYEVYVDGNGTPGAIVTSNQWTMTSANGLSTNSTHSFAVDYTTFDGRRSPLSPSTSATTWSGAYIGGSDYGVPIEWIENYYGLNALKWPSNVNAPLVAGGPSIYQVFQSGGNPTDSTTWLQQYLTKTATGMRLNWNTQPGAYYQVQTTSDFKNWVNLGTPHFAVGTTDSSDVGANTASYYRVVLLR
jgi:hypothetical protein